MWIERVPFYQIVPPAPGQFIIILYPYWTIFVNEKKFNPRYHNGKDYFEWKGSSWSVQFPFFPVVFLLSVQHSLANPLQNPSCYLTTVQPFFGPVGRNENAFLRNVCISISTSFMDFTKKKVLLWYALWKKQERFL